MEVRLWSCYTSCFSQQDTSRGLHSRGVYGGCYRYVLVLDKPLTHSLYVCGLSYPTQERNFKIVKSPLFAYGILTKFKFDSKSGYAKTFNESLYKATPNSKFSSKFKSVNFTIPRLVTKLKSMNIFILYSYFCPATIH